MRAAGRKPRIPTKLATKTARYIGRIFDEFAAAHAGRNDINHIFIQTVLGFYAVENNIFDLEHVDKNLGDIPSELVGDLRNRLTTDNDVGFDWSVNAAVIGALVESVVNPRTKAREGVCYVPVENIHRVLDPLIFDGLRAELEQCGTERRKLRALHRKIAALKILDPAFGAGSFIVETYIGLRRLEDEIIAITDDPIKVSTDQFFGIEINDFAVEIAQTVMWLVECQSTGRVPERRTYPQLVRGNAVELDWSELAPKVDYIIGSPPSIGMIHHSKKQKLEIAELLRDKDGKQYSKIGKFDYAACWFYKAAQYMFGRKTRTAFATTDSLCQSEQAQLVWQPLFRQFGVHIDFAYQPIKWIIDCVRVQRNYGIIVGFSSARNDQPRRIFERGAWIEASNINGYLLDAPNIFIVGQLKTLCKVPEIHRGNQATDGGNLIIELKDYKEFVRREPGAKKFIRRFMMGREFVNNLPRWCLWLTDATPEEIAALPSVARRVEAVRKFREASTFIKTQRLAKKPHLFREQITLEKFIAIPKVLSDKRTYLTAGWLSSQVIAGDQLFMIDGAGLYEFGVLESSVHMAWVRALGGRFGAGYCYSKTIIYNNFVWCTPTEEQRLEIERTAQGILDVRAKFEDWSLARLYDDKTMPEELLAAHEENDRAVEAAYGFEGLSEVQIVSRLMTECARLLGFVG